MVHRWRKELWRWYAEYWSWGNTDIARMSFTWNWKLIICGRKNTKNKTEMVLRANTNLSPESSVVNPSGYAQQHKVKRCGHRMRAYTRQWHISQEPQFIFVHSISSITRIRVCFYLLLLLGDNPWGFPTVYCSFSTFILLWPERDNPVRIIQEIYI